MRDRRQDPRAGGEPLLIGCALKKETDFLRRCFGDHHHFITTGLGIRRSRFCLNRYLQTFRPRGLLFTGTAGQLSPDLKMGQSVVPAVWQLENGRPFPNASELVQAVQASGWEVAGVGLTVRRPVVGRAHRAALFHRHRALVCDMESACVLQVAGDFGIPALVVKVVADTAESGIAGFREHFETNMGKLALELEQLLPRL
jgi:nucleoside phosphorylase